jgi:mono/diheme cytochrome c family protein
MSGMLQDKARRNGEPPRLPTRGTRRGRPLSAVIAPLASALCGLILSGCQHTGTPSDADLIEDGRVIAQSQCGGCHATGLADASARKDAPPLREISRRYQFPVLEQELIQGIKLGHATMPHFQFSPRGTDALLAYIRHIQVADHDAGANAPSDK